ncbi:MAG: hypothetical protein FWH26_07650 [Oscillospiraceae bacterium]|nr:hypothetical protein [Oscillospiraceae bacterium]
MRLKAPHHVVLLGSPSDTSLTLPLCRALESLGGVLFAGHGCLAAYGAPEASRRRFLLWETEALFSLGAENALLVLKQGTPFPQDVGGVQRLTVLADHPAPAFPALRGVEWIGCACGEGRSELALSSLREDRAVAELRRPLTRPDGKALEPGEFPIRLSAPMEGYPLLCCCAVELLFGA